MGKVRKKSEIEEVLISQFKATCLSILARVQRTKKPILVLRKGEPISQVVPPPLLLLPPSWLGLLSSSGEILVDILGPASSPEEWKAFRA